MQFRLEELVIMRILLFVALSFISYAVGIYIVKPAFSKVLENRNEPIEPGTDAPLEEYWREELARNS